MNLLLGVDGFLISKNKQKSYVHAPLEELLGWLRWRREQPRPGVRRVRHEGLAARRRVFGWLLRRGLTLVLALPPRVAVDPSAHG